MSDKEKQMYQDLFTGKTSAYEDYIRQSYSEANSSEDLPTSPSSFFDYLEPLLPDDSSQSSNQNAPEINFQYRHYNGEIGKITEVQFSYDYNGKIIQQIQ